MAGRPLADGALAWPHGGDQGQPIDAHPSTHQPMDHRRYRAPTPLRTEITEPHPGTQGTPSHRSSRPNFALHVWHQGGAPADGDPSARWVGGDDVDQADDSGVRLPVPDVLGGPERLRWPDDVPADRLLRPSGHRRRAVPGPRPGRSGRGERRATGLGGDGGAPVADAGDAAGPGHRSAAGPSPGSGPSGIRRRARPGAEGAEDGGRVRPDVQRTEVGFRDVGARGRGDPGADRGRASGRVGVRHRVCGGAGVRDPDRTQWRRVGGCARGGRGGVRALGLACG
jgi:hypothetical protein